MRSSARPVGLFVALAAAAAALVACGGESAAPSAGSGVPTAAPVLPTVTTAPGHPSPAPASSSAAPAASSAATSAPLAISGTVAELVSGTALAGFAVIVGQRPNVTTCLAGQTETVQPCGTPAAPLAIGTTAASGAFSVTVPNSGTYMLTIGKDGTFATLHRTVTVGVSSASLGVVHVAALSSDEQAWLADVNNQRVTVSFPASYGNLVVDEYAEEEARAWATDVASGATTFGDSGYGAYAEAYLSQPGALYSAGAAVLAFVSGESAYAQADTSWMSEKANCGDGNWETCVFAEDTGHYINLSNTDTVWAGLGETLFSTAGPTSAPRWPYGVVLIEN